MPIQTSSRFVRTTPSLQLCAALTFAVVTAASAAEVHHDHDHDHDHDHSDAAGYHAKPTSRVSSPLGGARAVPTVTKLPALPKGVSELKFNDFFVKPAGPRGLELTEKLRSLDGQRVRILGYMAHRDVQPTGTFLLTPFPVEIHDHDNSLAEDMPMSVVHATVPHWKDQPVPYVRGLMLLTGTLNVGNRPEADGRMSLVRLELDPPAKHRSSGPFSKRGTSKGAEILRQDSNPPIRSVAQP